MRRKLVRSVAATEWIEQQQHALAAAEKGVSPFLPADKRQAQNVGIKEFGFRQVIHIKARFENVLHFHASFLPWRAVIGGLLSTHPIPTIVTSMFGGGADSGQSRRRA